MNGHFGPPLASFKVSTVSVLSCSAFKTIAMKVSSLTIWRGQANYSVSNEQMLQRIVGMKLAFWFIHKMPLLQCTFLTNFTPIHGIKKSQQNLGFRLSTTHIKIRGDIARSLSWNHSAEILLMRNVDQLSRTIISNWNLSVFFLEKFLCISHDMKSYAR